MTINNRLFGSAPNQLSRNRDLGDMAWQNAAALSIGTMITTGNVGIGTASPSFLSGYGGVQISGVGANSSVLKLTNSTTGTTATDGFDLIVGNASSDAYVWQRESANLIFGTASTDRMRIDSSGRLLVGTTSATGVSTAWGNLFLGDITTASTKNAIIFGETEAASESNLPLICQRSSGGASQDLALVAHSTNGAIRFVTGASSGSVPFTSTNLERMRITSAGNVGIGITTPLVKFQVAGSSILCNNTAIDPDTYANAVVAGAVTDGSGFGLSSAIGGNAGVGDSWGMGHNGIGWFLGIGNGSTANSLQSYLQLDPNRNMYLVPASGNVGIGTITPGFKLEVNGSFAATTKSFLIDHPTQPGRKLCYGSLEGPENGVYVRGRLTGSNTIDLPEYWTKLVDSASITVQLTPVGHDQSLYVKSVDNNQVVVGNSNWFRRGIDCYYVIFGERADVEPLQVERD